MVYINNIYIPFYTDSSPLSIFLKIENKILLSMSSQDMYNAVIWAGQGLLYEIWVLLG